MCAAMAATETCCDAVETATTYEHHAPLVLSKVITPPPECLPFPCKYVCGPMVNASDLPFRMLVRRYGVDTAFTQMFLAKDLIEDEVLRAKALETCDGDRPLILQLAGDDAASMVQAALLVQSHVDAVDINLGCPQEKAREGHYGSFLTDRRDWPTIAHIVASMRAALRIPVTCKIRLQDTVEHTVAFAKLLEDAGCCMLTVHGRKRGSERRRREGSADMAAVGEVARTLRIPVLANGNVRTHADVHHNMHLTGAAGIMSAEGILRHPAVFQCGSGCPDGSRECVAPITLLDRYRYVREYLQLAKELCCNATGEIKTCSALTMHQVQGHIAWMLGKEGHGRGVRFDCGITMKPLELKDRILATATVDDALLLMEYLELTVESCSTESAGYAPA